MIKIVFFGQARFIKESSESILENLIKPNNITDIYANFWIPDGEFKPEVISNSIGLSNISDFIQIYNPKKIVLEKQKNFELLPFKRIYGNCSYEWTQEYEKYHNIALQSVCYNRKQSLNIDQFNDNDLIILMRSDLIFNSPLNISSLSIDNESIYSLPHSIFQTQDIFYIGRFKKLKQFTDQYDYLYNHCKKDNSLVAEVVVCNMIKSVANLKTFQHPIFTNTLHYKYK